MNRPIHWFKYTLIPWFTALGLSKGTVTLQVRGRKSGKPIRVSLTTVRQQGKRYLVSLYPNSEWVKNVHAANGQVILVSGHETQVQLVEIPVEQRAPILYGYVQQRAFSHSGEESAQIFFGLGPKPTLQEMAAIADRFVVFQIQEI